MQVSGIIGVENGFEAWLEDLLQGVETLSGTRKSKVTSY